MKLDTLNQKGTKYLYWVFFSLPKGHRWFCMFYVDRDESLFYYLFLLISFIGDILGYSRNDILSIEDSLATHACMLLSCIRMHLLKSLSLGVSRSPWIQPPSRFPINCHTLAVVKLILLMHILRLFLIY